MSMRFFLVCAWITGDLGQTHNSSSTLQHLIANQPPVVVLVGDLSYSDNYAEDGSRDLRTVATTYPPRWDAWGRFMQPLAAQVHPAAAMMCMQTPCMAVHCDFLGDALHAQSTL